MVTLYIFALGDFILVSSHYVYMHKSRYNIRLIYIVYHESPQ